MEQLDWIRLTGLDAVGFHGVFPQERRDGQHFVVDVELGVHAETGTDDLAHTVDYSRVAADVVAVVEGEPVDLIETLAGRIADVCLSDERVQLARVCVHKPQAPLTQTFADVSVTITRSKR